MPSCVFFTSNKTTRNPKRCYSDVFFFGRGAVFLTGSTDAGLGLALVFADGSAFTEALVLAVAFAGGSVLLVILDVAAFFSVATFASTAAGFSAVFVLRVLCLAAALLSAAGFTSGMISTRF